MSAEPRELRPHVVRVHAISADRLGPPGPERGVEAPRLGLGPRVEPEDGASQRAPAGVDQDGRRSLADGAHRIDHLEGDSCMDPAHGRDRRGPPRVGIGLGPPTGRELWRGRLRRLREDGASLIEHRDPNAGRSDVDSEQARHPWAQPAGFKSKSSSHR